VRLVVINCLNIPFYLTGEQMPIFFKFKIIIRFYKKF
jgi:hypothetical protein